MPVIAIAEVKGVMPQANPHGHGPGGAGLHHEAAHGEKEVAHV